MAVTNSEILSTIWEYASSSYQSRIPEQEKANATATMKTLTNYRPLMNEFLDGLVNRIGVTMFTELRNFDNPLAQFKRGQLELGDTIENVATNLIKGNRWDKYADYEDVFRTTKPDVRASYHKINREMQYPCTIRDYQLKRAFVSDTGIADMTGSILAAPHISDNFDEYIAMINLIKEMNNVSPIFNKHVDALAGTSADGDTMRMMARAIKATVNKFTFPTNAYNSSNITTVCPVSEQALFITADADAALDVEVLAAAFNMSKADYLGQRVVVDSLPIDGAYALLVDKLFYICADNFITNEGIRNPKAHSWNYYLTHSEVLSVNPFVNACLFSTGSSTTLVSATFAISGLTLDFADSSVTYVAPGTFTQLTSVVSGTASDTISPIPQGVTYEITGVTSPLALGTQINSDGILMVSKNEKNKTLTVTATSVYDNTKTHTLSVPTVKPLG